MTATATITVRRTFRCFKQPPAPLTVRAVYSFGDGSPVQLSAMVESGPLTGPTRQPTLRDLADGELTAYELAELRYDATNQFDQLAHAELWRSRRQD